MMRLSATVILVALAGAASGQQLAVHDVQVVEPELAKLVEKFGVGALDPFRSALDRVEVETRTSAALSDGLGIDDGLDLRPLLEARAVPISTDTIVGFSPSLGLVFFSAPWTEARVIRAFFNSQRGRWIDDFSVSGELWIYEIPVNQMELNGWRGRVTLADLESEAGAKLINYETFALRENTFNGEVGVTAPPSAFERRDGDEVYGFGGRRRERDPLSVMPWAYEHQTPGFIAHRTFFNSRSPGENPADWRQLVAIPARSGEAQVIPIGFQPRPFPRRWVAVIRYGAPLADPTKAQRAAIRRWRAFKPPDASDQAPDAEAVRIDAAFRQAAKELGMEEEVVSKELGLAVLSAPRNLLSLADPDGLGMPNSYSPARPFARSGVHPELFGDREVYDLRPFFQVGGSAMAAGSEAWLLPEPPLLFLRVTAGDLGLIAPVLDVISEAEPGRRLQLDFGCWLGVTPAQRPTPDLAATLTIDPTVDDRWDGETGFGFGFDVGVGVGVPGDSNSESPLAEFDYALRSMATGILINAGGDKLADKLAVRLVIQAKFPEPGGDRFLAFRTTETVTVTDGQTQYLTIEDSGGSGQQLLVEISQTMLRSDGTAELAEGTLVQQWIARWRAVFE